MVPVAGRPILVWLLDAMQRAGVDEVQIVVGYKADRIQAALGDGSDLGLSISYVRQDVLLGSAAALETALSDGGIPESAIVIGGDNIVDASLVRSLLDAGPNTLAVARSEEPSKYGVVRLDGTTVQGIEEKPPIEGEALVSTGAVHLDRGVLERVPELVERGNLGLASVLDHVARSGPGLEAVVDEGRWFDAVYPWDLLQLSEELVTETESPAKLPEGVTATGPIVLSEGATVEPGAIVRGPTSIGENAHIQAGAIVSESVVMADAVVGAGARVERSIVGDGARIRGGATLARGRGIAETEEGVHLLEDIGPLVGEGCIVEGGALLFPACLIGNNARVRTGAHARGRTTEHGEVS